MTTVKQNSQTKSLYRLQNGKFPRRSAKGKIINLDKVRKLAWNNKRRRHLLTGQSSNTTSVKNNGVVLDSTDVQCQEVLGAGVECCDDRRFLLPPSNSNDLESKQNATAYTEVTWDVPLSVYCPYDNQAVQMGIAKCEKRKMKSHPAKSK